MIAALEQGKFEFKQAQAIPPYFKPTPKMEGFCIRGYVFFFITRALFNYF